MAECYETVHQGYRPVRMLVRELFLWPPKLAFRHYRFCTHPIHISKVMMHPHTEPTGKPRGSCRIVLQSGDRWVRIQAPVVNPTREHELCFIDALRIVSAA